MTGAIFKFLYKKHFTPDGLPREGANVTNWGPPENRNRERYLEKYGAKNAVSKKVARKSQPVKRHSRVKNLPKSATKHAKGASLLTRRIPGSTLS